MEYIHTLLLSRVAESETSTAIEDSTGIYSYKDLHNRGLYWREYLKQLNISHGDRIALVADASFESISLIVGCSLGGIIFSAISPETPNSRRDVIVNDLEASIVIADNSVSDGLVNDSNLLNGPDGCRFIVVKTDYYNKSLKKLDRTKTTTTDPGYIVFTSGSTGTPKGIVMSHRSIVSYWGGLIEQLKLKPGNRYSSLSPLQFDFSLFDIGVCLGSGATLVLPSRGMLRKPLQLVEFIAKKAITHFSGVPTIWKMILQTAQSKISILSSLEKIVFAGEHFPVEHMKAIKKLLPKVEYFNAYGQSETIGCTFHLLNDHDLDKPHIPVGKPHRDMKLILVDQNDCMIDKPGVQGELLLGGSTLFSGYWKKPDLTSERLIQNPFNNSYSEKVFRSGDICYFDADGLFYYIGRKDNQIKINGNRIELEEIEAAINKHPIIINCCVLAIRNEGAYSLHAVAVTETSGDENEESVRKYLGGTIPTYMLPKYFHFVSEIPFNENGKNDRKKVMNMLGLIETT